MLYQYLKLAFPSIQSNHPPNVSSLLEDSSNASSKSLYNTLDRIVQCIEPSWWSLHHKVQFLDRVLLKLNCLWYSPTLFLWWDLHEQKVGFVQHALVLGIQRNLYPAADQSSSTKLFFQGIEWLVWTTNSCFWWVEKLFIPQVHSHDMVLKINWIITFWLILGRFELIVSCLSRSVRCEVNCVCQFKLASHVIQVVSDAKQ